MSYNLCHILLVCKLGGQNRIFKIGKMYNNNIEVQHLNPKNPLIPKILVQTKN